MTWYVVACGHRSGCVSDPRDYFQGEDNKYGDDPAEFCIWTLSENPDEEGWNTDGGFEGYGLPYAKAKELADAANAELAQAAP